MATRYPRSGKGRRWTVLGLKAIPSAWAGDVIADGDGLVADVRATADGDVSLRFRYAYRWAGKLCWYQCGTWPATSLDAARAARDEARVLLRSGINPSDNRKAEKVQAQQAVEQTLASEHELRLSRRTVRDLFDVWIVDGVARRDGNKQLRALFELHALPALANTELSQLSESQLAAPMRALVGKGKNRTAVQLGQAFKAMLGWAEDRKPWRQLLIEGNPAKLIDLEKIVAPDYDIRHVRTRRLADEEIRELDQIFARMNASTQSIERTRLHQLVWQTPASQLAPTFGMTDRGLAKLCARHGIPIPTRGHWQRPAARRRAAVPMPAEPSPQTPIDLSAAQRRLNRQTQHALWICLSTLCRIGELTMAEWKHVNFDAGEWFIPRDNVKGTKGKRQDHMVFLSDFTLRQFKLLHELAGSSRWVFPSRVKQDSHIPLKAITAQVWERQARFHGHHRPLPHRTLDDTLVLAGGENGQWTPHDLRRTGATMMQVLGVSPTIIDRCQNHVLAGSHTRRSYLLYDYAEEKREAWARLGVNIERILKGDEKRARTQARTRRGLSGSPRGRPLSSAATG